MAQLPTTHKSQGGRLARRTDHPLEQLRRDFDTLFGRMWTGWPMSFEQDFGSMRVWDFDVTENDKEVTVRADLPGFEPNELDVQLTDDVLTVKAEKEQKGESEREYRSFFRSITLPTGIDREKVQANYRNGVLELHIPRAEGAQPKRINVQGSSGTTQAQLKTDQSKASATQGAKK